MPIGEKEIDPAKKLKLGYLIAAAIFFCNPLFNLIDVLPDFIGALLILASLSRLRDLSAYLASARKWFLALFWVSLSKIPSFVWMFRIFSSHPTERTIMLLFTFVYAVGESVLLVLAFRDLFDGIVYLGERHDGASAFSLTQKNKKIPVAAICRTSILSLVLIHAFSVVPELIYLMGDSERYEMTGYVAPEHFKGFFTLFATLAALAPAVLFVRRFTRYIGGIRRDGVFCAALLADAERVEREQPKQRLYRRFAFFSGLASVCALLSFRFFLDDFNICPEILFSGLLLAAVLYWHQKIAALGKGTLLFSASALVLSGAALFFAIRFNLSFDFSAVGRESSANGAFILWVVSEFFAALLSLITVFLLSRTVFSFCQKELTTAGEKVGSFSSEDIRSLRARKIRLSVYSVLYFVSGNVLRLSLGDTASVPVGRNEFDTALQIYLPKLQGYWIFDVALFILLSSAAFLYFEEMRSDLRHKYLLLD